jgi:hypothetical protein
MSGIKLLRTAGSALLVGAGAATLYNREQWTGLRLPVVQAKAPTRTQHPNADLMDPHGMNYSPGKWDWNWDRRAEDKNKAKAKEPKEVKEGEKEEEKPKKPTATRKEN